MLAAYLVCLIIGGVFVGMSVISGLGKDAGGFDKGDGFDKELGFEADVDADLAADAPDFDADVDGDFHGPHVGDVALAGERGRAEDDEEPRRKRRRPAARRSRPWIPLLSFRFWTFGAAFFGLTGTLLTALALTVEPTTLFASLAMGVGVGTVTSAAVRALSRPVGRDGVATRELVGQSGELLFDLEAGRTSKARFRVRHVSADLLVITDYPQRLPAGTRVIVLGVARDGRLDVAPESSAFLEGPEGPEGIDEPTTRAARAEAQEEEQV